MNTSKQDQVRRKTSTGSTRDALASCRFEFENGTDNGERIFLPSRIVPLFLMSVLSLLLILPGCSRQKYREKADTEVYDLLNTVGDTDPLWKMAGFSLDQDGTSRYGNFYDPENQPMPQDDSAAYRLMQCVDGKKGGKRWLKNGVIDHVDNENWRKSLPEPVNGEIIIDKDTAFRLALLHSPNYRTALENVYMSALAVTGERFAFDVQFYGGESLFYNNHGGFRQDSTSTLRNEVGNFNDFMTKKFATGGELVVSLANSLVWTFSPSSQTFNPTTTIGYSFTQPFLRGAGRAIVLEDLTLTERQLLATVRQLAFYQQGFYINVLTGSSPVNAPARSGYSNFGISVPSGISSGFYGLLLEQVQIRNQLANVMSLQDNANRYEEYFKAGQVEDRYDVDRVRQSLLSGQSTLISRKNTYRNSVDSFLVMLGLPPDIDNVVIQDNLLDQFVLMPKQLEELSGKLDATLGQLRDKDKPLPENPKEVIKMFRDGINAGEEEVVGDINHLVNDIYPNRKKGFELLLERLKKDHPEVDSSFCEPKLLDKRISIIQGDYDRKGHEVDDYGNERKKGVKWVLEDVFRLLELTVGTYDVPTLTRMLHDTQANPGKSPFSQEVIDLVYELQLESLLIGDDSVDFEQQIEGKTFTGSEGLDEETKKKLAKEYGPVVEKEANQLLRNTSPKGDIYRIWFRDCLARFSEELMSLRLIQARARLESIHLSVIDISPEAAFEIASEYRFDWMNARSNLVDQWRNIEIVANRLKGVLDLTVAGDISNEGSNPLNFSSKEANFSAGVKFDAPLARLLERNDYRRALISYDQARRSYYTYIDNVNAQLRSNIRTIRFDQMNFELQRENVLVAIQRVEQAQLSLVKPPTASRIGAISSTAAQNLVDALTALLEYQNSLVQNWLQYQVRRMGLLLALGLFEIDSTGRWVDPGDINKEFLSKYSSEITGRQDDLAGINQLPTTEQLSGGKNIDDIKKAVAEDQTPPNAQPDSGNNAAANATAQTGSPVKQPAASPTNPAYQQRQTVARPVSVPQQQRRSPLPQSPQAQTLQQSTSDTAVSPRLFEMEGIASEQAAPRQSGLGTTRKINN